MNAVVKILDHRGDPMPRGRGVGRQMAGNSAPYDAGHVGGSHMSTWQPYLGSPDTELNPWRDRIVSRVRDLVRNDGWASGGVSRILDATVGANFRLIPTPDYRALAAISGAAFDAVWAKEFRSQAQALWRTWAEDHGRWSDASRNLTITQIFRLAFRHKLIDGDSVAILLNLPERRGVGRARYSTTVQLVDPDRLSNPFLTFDMKHLRGGVEIDDFGAAVAYHFRKAHQGDWYDAARAFEWERVERETRWGRPIVVHDFDQDRAGQHRGGAGIFTPVLERMRMLARYDSTELDAAIVNAIFGAYFVSPFDHEIAAEALGGGSDVSKYQDQRADFHNENRINLAGVRIPSLFPGEDIKAIGETRPNNSFEAFESAMLRNVASAIGLSAPQLTQNWSEVNYSSARAALLEAWKTLARRRDDFARGFCDPIYGAWLEEAMMRDELPLPADAPLFIEARSSYSRCRWIGPGRGWIDPVKEKQGAILGMDAALTTLEMEAAEQGMDWEENLDQRAIEVEEFKRRGLKLPQWAGKDDATEAAQKPEKPEAE